MTELFNEETTISALVAKRPKTRRVFEQYGIDYCCGGYRDLKTAAAEKNVPLDGLLSALKQAIESPAASPDDEKDWSTVSLSELVTHIEQRHHTFMKAQLPRLVDLLAKVLKAHGPKHGKVLLPLQNAYFSLKAEIDEHLFKEEQILFPLIRQIDAYTQGRGPMPVSHCGSVQNPIQQMRHEHDNARDALVKMRTVTSDYKLPADACESFRALYEGLAAIEADLHQHIHLENNILYPRAIELESTYLTVGEE